MSSRFESWFLHFVAEHNTPAAGLGGGDQIDEGHEGLADGVGQTAWEALSVSNDNRHIGSTNVLPFRPRDAFKGNSLSVA